MFVARIPEGPEAAVLLLDWKAAMSNATFEAGFGGYSGEDAGKSTFVFTKGTWIAGVVGLPEKDAYAAARDLAARLY